MSLSYYKHELGLVKPDDGIIRVKFIGNGETKWLNLTPQEYEAVKELLLNLIQEKQGSSS